MAELSSRGKGTKLAWIVSSRRSLVPARAPSTSITVYFLSQPVPLLHRTSLSHAPCSCPSKNLKTFQQITMYWTSSRRTFQMPSLWWESKSPWEIVPFVSLVWISPNSQQNCLNFSLKLFLKCSVWKPALKQTSKWALCYEWRFWENHGQFIPGTQAPVSLGFPWTPWACLPQDWWWLFFLRHRYVTQQIPVSGLSLPSRVLSQAQGSLWWNAAKWYYLPWAGCCRLNTTILYIAQHRAHRD